MYQYFLNKNYLHYGATLTDYENVMFVHFNYKNHSRFLQACLIVLPEFNFQSLTDSNPRLCHTLKATGPVFVQTMALWINLDCLKSCVARF